MDNHPLGIRIQRFFKQSICFICFFIFTGDLFASNQFSTRGEENTDSIAELPLPPPTKDPLERFNRAMFGFNEQIDIFILKPVATVYNKILPSPLNAGIHNFFDNLNNFPTIWNDILQLHFYQALNDTWRLLINSTIGIGGLFDVASNLGLPPYTNDFGLTLARYGWRQSTYIVLPFFGPNTLRDTIQIPVDYYAFSIYPAIHPVGTRYAFIGVSIVDKRAQLLKVESVLDEAALDRYLFIRSAYTQRRAFQIQENNRLNFIAPTDTNYQSCQRSRTSV